MKEEEILEILNMLTSEYLKKNRKKEDTVILLNQKINILDITQLDNEFITSGYYALKYLTDEYETTDYEMEYMRDCYEGKRRFSQEDRNEFIKRKLKS
ncbi:MAG TPA: hypothetical protein DEP72_02910 [Clostridiales bacterium]|nr:MAG: hypothetical protein A2Y18_07815 [Clostridiales bacterium GWD2_32_19]HCC07104.1 hypothetical protein [Clostridiales bacterium]